ncbi:hypothetical protein [Prauserella alba]|nr:hypothetical protein [Prauserella alba]
MDDGARIGTGADGDEHAARERQSPGDSPREAAAAADAALRDVADELYALDRAEFTRTRDQRARSAGDRDLAARIRKLRKPTVAAARVNRFARRNPGRVGQLRGLGDELRAAHGELDGDRIRELSQRRSDLVRELSELEAADADLDVSREVHDTFDAAVTDAGAGEAVARGCLAATLQPGDVFAAGWPSPDVAGRGPRAAATARPHGLRSEDLRPESHGLESPGLESHSPESHGLESHRPVESSGDSARRAQAGMQDREHRDDQRQRRERNRRDRQRREPQPAEDRIREQRAQHEDGAQRRREQEPSDQERREKERERERRDQERKERDQERKEQERREQWLRERRELRRRRSAELAEARAAFGAVVTELREAEAAEAEARRRTIAARKAFDAADRRVSEAEAALAEVTEARADPE